MVRREWKEKHEVREYGMNDDMQSYTIGIDENEDNTQ
jgi:hypothetical protein